jgi:hypothetical protein
LALVRRSWRESTAGANCLHLELHLGEIEILLIDNPRSTLNDLRRWQNLLADEPFHNGIASP